MSPSHAIILHINLPGSSFKEAVAKRSNLSVQRHTVLFTSNWLCIYSIMLSLVYGEIQEYMYTTLCVRKILWHSMQGFPVTLEHMFQYNVGLEATFWTSSQCDGDRGMLRHTHVCVIVLLWIKWPNVIGNEYASHDCYSPSLNNLMYFHTEI